MTYTEFLQVNGSGQTTEKCEDAAHAFHGAYMTQVMACVIRYKGELVTIVQHTE